MQNILVTASGLQVCCKTYSMLSECLSRVSNGHDTVRTVIFDAHWKEISTTPSKHEPKRFRNEWVTSFLSG